MAVRRHTANTSVFIFFMEDVDVWGLCRRPRLFGECRRWRGAAVAVQWLTSNLGEPDSIPREVAPGVPHVGIVPDGRRIFFGHIPLPPPLYSTTAPYSLCFILVCCQNSIVKSRPNLPTLTATVRCTRFSDLSLEPASCHGDGTRIISPGKGQTIPLLEDVQNEIRGRRCASDDRASHAAIVQCSCIPLLRCVGLCFSNGGKYVNPRQGYFPLKRVNCTFRGEKVSAFASLANCDVPHSPAPALQRRCLLPQSSRYITSTVDLVCAHRLLSHVRASHFEQQTTSTPPHHVSFPVWTIVAPTSNGTSLLVFAQQGLLPLFCHHFPDQGGKREIPEKALRPAAPSGTIPTCENQGVTRPGIEPGSPRLTAQPPRPYLSRKLIGLHEGVFSYHKIAALMGHTVTTVMWVWKHWTEENRTSLKPETGQLTSLVQVASSLVRGPRARLVSLSYVYPRIFLAFGSLVNVLAARLTNCLPIGRRAAPRTVQLAADVRDGPTACVQTVMFFTLSSSAPVGLKRSEDGSTTECRDCGRRSGTPRENPRDLRQHPLVKIRVSTLRWYEESWVHSRNCIFVVILKHFTHLWLGNAQRPLTTAAFNFAPSCRANTTDIGPVYLLRPVPAGMKHGAGLVRVTVTNCVSVTPGANSPCDETNDSQGRAIGSSAADTTTEQSFPSLKCIIILSMLCSTLWMCSVIFRRQRRNAELVAVLHVHAEPCVSDTRTWFDAESLNDEGEIADHA
ncbi:hypothetical protein PR048_005915 [Dryococelus australis]|uniref:Uncharacterized protein n=1 Tax=Dryococelus australis TaxID=614101 RepID=A0ABQ9I9I9_9NEOP|nr:hypothetical protein PR048_005915 [Dryococelus australis]